MTRKPRGPFKPTNTLNQLGPSANTLATYTSRGHNVSGGSNKRQKTSHVPLEDAADDTSDDNWFNRDLQSQSSVGIRRQSSAISINSQENPSQKSDFFGYDAARNVHGILNQTKKKGRKPKAGTVQHSSPHQQGAKTDPVPVDDDDDVHLPGEKHTEPRSKHYTAIARRSRSPTLQEKFVRDDSGPDLVHEDRQPPSKIRNKMQSASNTSRITQPPPVVAELSEDELSREPAVQPPARKNRNTARSPSPNAITSTFFPTMNKGKKAEDREKLILHVSSLRMMAGNWENLDLIYSWANKVMQFTKNGEMFSNNGGIIQVSSKHATRVTCDLKCSTAVILTGSNGGISRGRILFDFDTMDERDTFLEAVAHMNSRVLPQELKP